MAQSASPVRSTRGLAHCSHAGLGSQCFQLGRLQVSVVTTHLDCCKMDRIQTRVCQKNCIYGYNMNVFTINFNFI